MFSQILSAVLYGLEVVPIRVETDTSAGLPQFVMVGYLSAQVREAQDRIRTAFRNTGISLPPSRITINFSPADIPKSGSRFDLPVALSVLASNSLIPPDSLRDTMAIGELSLDGRINSVTGVLPIAIKAKECRIQRLVVPHANLREASCVSGIDIVGIRNLNEVLDFFRHGKCPEPASESDHLPSAPAGDDVDLSDIRGQAAAIRAATIAVAGFHNLLLIGPPGSGKSMLARRIPTILPSVTPEEQLEVARIYSVAGLLDHSEPLRNSRPFRSPHHTISPQALAGGGRIPVPGEITLSHRGVLFLDEFPEFRRSALEILRQPLEDHEIVISRTTATFRFPAHFLLLAAMNPCPCGYFPDMTRCTCSPNDVSRYIGKISKPLLDRIDLCAECPTVTYEELTTGKNSAPTSAEIRSRVEDVRRIQQKRFQGTKIRFNSEIPSSRAEELCRLSAEARTVLEAAYDRMKLSARSCHRVMKTARTIADLDGSGEILAGHLREALLYRVIDGKYWRL